MWIDPPPPSAIPPTHTQAPDYTPAVILWLEHSVKGVGFSDSPLQVPSIALAYEKAESDIMNRKPRHKKKDRLVNKQLALYSYLHIGMIRAVLSPRGHSQKLCFSLWGGVGVGGGTTRRMRPGQF